MIAGTKHFYLVLCAIVLGGTFGCSKKGESTDTAPAESPEIVAKKFVDAYFVGDAKTAIALTAEFPKVDKQKLEKKFQRSEDPLSKALKPKTPPEVRGSKVDGEIAVVIVLERPTDPDPVYLLRQGGVWRVLPEVTQYDEKDYEFPAEVTARYAALKSWHKEQESQIRTQTTK